MVDPQCPCRACVCGSFYYYFLQSPTFASRPPLQYSWRWLANMYLDHALIMDQPVRPYHFFSHCHCHQHYHHRQKMQMMTQQSPQFKCLTMSFPKKHVKICFIHSPWTMPNVAFQVSFIERRTTTKTTIITTITTAAAAAAAAAVILNYYHCHLLHWK